MVTQRSALDEPAARISVIAVLVLAVCVPGGCSERRPSPGPPEIIVQLKEDGRRLTTERDGRLLYGGRPLTIFDELPDAEHLEIRQSFPEFSKRWQRELEWRAGHNDSAALGVLATGSHCSHISHADAVVLGRIRARWEGDHKTVLAYPAAIPSITLLLHRLSRDASADSANASAFIREIRNNGIVGQRDTLAVPAILRFLNRCPLISSSDSVMVLRFVRRVRQDGGLDGISDVAADAILRLTRSEPIGIEDSLAVASWIRLLGGDDAAPRTVPGGAPAAVDLYLRISVTSPEVKTDSLLARLRRTDGVEFAVRAFPLARELPRGGLSLIGGARALNDVTLAEGVQDYQRPPPSGIDAEYSWTVNGGDGSRARVTVLDAGFSRHRDLPEVRLIGDTLGGLPQTHIDHGTMTLGVLAAKDNGDAIRGTAWKAAELWFATTRGWAGHGQNIHNSLHCFNTALDLAGSQESLDVRNLLADVLVIEDQLENTEEGTTSRGYGCCARPADPPYLPVEVNRDVFAAIATLGSAFHVTVVEPAGNGGRSLGAIADGPQYRWSPEWDSGAILVGAGDPSARIRWSTSNYGDRVDCRGWGSHVKSTSNPNVADGIAEYGGTSLATAIVGAAAACLQSAHVAKFGRVMAPTALRELLRSDDFGTPQENVNGERVGPLPNLRKLMDAVLSEPSQQVTAVGSPS